MLCADARSLIEALVGVLAQRGWAVENAHAREKWGAAWMTPDECTPLDFHGVMTADLLVAVPGNPISGGVCIEIGWASGVGVPVVLLLEKDADYSHLVVALHTVREAHEIRFDSIESACAGLDAWLAERTPRESPAVDVGAPSEAAT
jgi:hypothetical protein